MEIIGAISYPATALLKVEPLKLDDPRDDEVLVKIVATGLCHTDIAVHNGLIPVPAPVVLGHEGAGVVVRTGKNVRRVQTGDRVVLSLASCGHCRNCTSGRPTYCLEHQSLNWRVQRADGSVSLHAAGKAVHSHFFGQSSFAQYATVNASSVVKVPAEAPLEYLGPVACGIMTGAGAVMNSLSPPVGSSIAIFGVGAVGLAAVMAAQLSGCSPIIAIDINDDRLQVAKELGATHFINPAREELLAEINAITNNNGVQYSVEAAGSVKVMASAVSILAEQGCCVLTGVVGTGDTLPVDVMHLIRGRTIKGSIMGDAIPSIFIPTLVDLFTQGKFPIDKLITFYTLNEINQAIEDSQRGKCIKAVIKM
ncbi:MULTISPECIES: NAD(P)-dependent alcohol dehydrogenase [Serratia]|uniref:NAD(P)-dependent alcohol dehydrogenase n=1 Tax=Serratia TaxID=613 RepID=UPI000668E614|nr:NAD(P)-dependent alcohol dehydrogenase [Serratia marcescens]MBH3069834.1 NAD(P)-dependent alcohol dehydrogenase [Serratia marcescens]RTF46942.1 NAD(P)-dependent alcohol dehydrogenase [Serratia marcescens]BEN48336.1 aryl-alcohol dehydrogenase [Serratia marcescens]HAT3674485.1 NAD(P)-dependent alcohol dehydrogenase [Serratia marcescens]HEJ0329074.1 NAD(P)-dependent alcohol dehydrogenase [Serratia marcescens]